MTTTAKLEKSLAGFEKNLAALKNNRCALLSLRFPNYRNIEHDAILEFKFPITVLFGLNGTNKSSILQAIFGAQKGRSVGEYWFETALDPIPEKDDAGRKQSVTHTYVNHLDQRVECLKARAPRGVTDPDYWEAQKPTMVYGFDAGAKRVTPIQKPIEYLDFRQILPAFDKYFYFPDAQHLDRANKRSKRVAADKREAAAKITDDSSKAPALNRPDAKAKKVGLRRDYRPQDYLRRRAPLVRKLLASQGTEFSSDVLCVASSVLGRQYVSGRYVDHNCYHGHQGRTMKLITARFNEGYSDAYAGSGESAAITLIDHVENAKDGSILLLDEPETSLHPAAQQKLLRYLVYRSLTKKLQFVIATHSQYFGEGLPLDAIRLLRENDEGRITISSGFSAVEAIHAVAEKPKGKVILVEDEKAKALLTGAFATNGGGNLAKEFDVIVRRGGVAAIITDIKAHVYMPKTVLMVLDGDQRPAQSLPDNLPRTFEDLRKLADNVIRNSPSLSFEDEEDCLRFLKFVQGQVTYLPGQNPESLVCNIEAIDEFATTNVLKPKQVEAAKALLPNGKAVVKALADLVPGMKPDSVFDVLLARFLRSDLPEAIQLKSGLIKWIRDRV